jgi:hypothetical protein
LSYDDKKRLITDADAKKYPTQKALAAAYGISEVATSEILRKQREKVEEMATEGDLDMSRKRAKRFKHEDVDNALLEWLHYVDGKLPLTVAMLLEQAQRLAEQLGEKVEVIDTNWVGF